MSISLDANLEPYTTYEYRISAWNGYGREFSEAVRASTKEDVPQGVSPPQWIRTDRPEDGILLTWKKPIQPNGTKLLLRWKYRSSINPWAHWNGCNLHVIGMHLTSKKYFLIKWSWGLCQLVILFVKQPTPIVSPQFFFFLSSSLYLGCSDK